VCLFRILPEEQGTDELFMQPAHFKMTNDEKRIASPQKFNRSTPPTQFAKAIAVWRDTYRQLAARSKTHHLARSRNWSTYGTLGRLRSTPHVNVYHQNPNVWYRSTSMGLLPYNSPCWQPGRAKENSPPIYRWVMCAKTE
jgi:hypothetical protein